MKDLKALSPSMEIDEAPSYFDIELAAALFLKMEEGSYPEGKQKKWIYPPGSDEKVSLREIAHRVSRGKTDTLAWLDSGMFAAFVDACRKKNIKPGREAFLALAKDYIVDGIFHLRLEQILASGGLGEPMKRSFVAKSVDNVARLVLHMEGDTMPEAPRVGVINNYVGMIEDPKERERALKEYMGEIQAAGQKVLEGIASEGDSDG